MTAPKTLAELRAETDEGMREVAERWGNLESFLRPLVAELRASVGGTEKWPERLETGETLVGAASGPDGRLPIYAHVSPPAEPGPSAIQDGAGPSEEQLFATWLGDEENRKLSIAHGVNGTAIAFARHVADARTAELRGELDDARAKLVQTEHERVQEAPDTVDTICKALEEVRTRVSKFLGANREANIAAALPVRGEAYQRISSVIGRLATDVSVSSAVQDGAGPSEADVEAARTWLKAQRGPVSLGPFWAESFAAYADARTAELRRERDTAVAEKDAIKAGEHAWKIIDDLHAQIAALKYGQTPAARGGRAQSRLASMPLKSDATASGPRPVTEAEVVEWLDANVTHSSTPDNLTWRCVNHFLALRAPSPDAGKAVFDAAYDVLDNWETSLDDDYPALGDAIDRMGDALALVPLAAEPAETGGGAK